MNQLYQCMKFIHILSMMKFVYSIFLPRPEVVFLFYFLYISIQYWHQNSFWDDLNDKKLYYIIQNQKKTNHSKIDKYEGEYY